MARVSRVSQLTSRRQAHVDAYPRRVPGAIPDGVGALSGHGTFERKKEEAPEAVAHIPSLVFARLSTLFGSLHNDDAAVASFSYLRACGGAEAMGAMVEQIAAKWLTRTVFFWHMPNGDSECHRDIVWSPHVGSAKRTPGCAFGK